MTRLRTAFIDSLAFVGLSVAVATAAQAQALNTFGVLAGQALTNTGSTTVDGNIGNSPGAGSLITGFPPGAVTGAIYGGDDLDNVADNAQGELTILYNAQHGQSVTQTLTGQNLGNRVLTPGVYEFADAAQLTGTLTLDGLNGTDPFIFIIGSTLTTASNSTVALIHGALGSNVYFVVGSSATLGTDTTFTGRILATTSITLNTRATITCGAALAETGSVTLDTNVISNILSAGCAVVDDTFAEVLGPTATDNERAVGDAIDAYIAANGIGALPTGFASLLSDLSPAELANAFEQLSGEGATGAPAAGIQAMDSFLSAIFGNAFGDTSGGPGTGPGDNSGRSPGTVKALGYDSDPRQGGAQTAITELDPLPSEPFAHRVWAAAYGGESNTGGDASIGTHDRSTSNLGFAGGYDRQISSNTGVGFALGGGGTRFSLSDDLGSGKSDMFQAAAYARMTSDHAYLTTALAYAYHSVSTSRHVVIDNTVPPVDDHYTAAYSAHDVAGEIEAGYRMGWVTPYAAVRVGAYFTPAYSESGAGDFYQASTTTSLRTELGARFAHTVALRNGTTLGLNSRIAWAHDFGSNPQMTAGFQALPAGPTFNVGGAEAPRDWLLLSAGAEFGFGNGFAIAGIFDGAFAENAETWSGTAKASYRW